MNKSTFIQTLENLNSIKNIEVKEVDELTKKFPYFQLGQQLSAKVHHEKETKLSSNKLKISSIYSTSRSILKRLINKTLTPTLEKAVEIIQEPIAIALPKAKHALKTENAKVTTNLSSPVETETIPSFKRSNISKMIERERNTISLKRGVQKTEISTIKIAKYEDIERILNFNKPTGYDFLKDNSNINLENLFPKPKKVKPFISDLLIPDGLGAIFGITDSYLGEIILSTENLKENHTSDLVLKNKKPLIPTVTTSELVDSFLANKPKINKLKELDSEPKRDDLSKKKAKGLGNNVTETMAKIYLAQGNIKKAKNIFEKLMVLYPQKKTYFAEILQDLNK